MTEVGAALVSVGIATEVRAELAEHPRFEPVPEPSSVRAPAIAKWHVGEGTSMRAGKSGFAGRSIVPAMTCASWVARGRPSLTTSHRKVARRPPRSRIARRSNVTRQLGSREWKPRPRSSS